MKYSKFAVYSLLMGVPAVLYLMIWINQGSDRPPEAGTVVIETVGTSHIATPEMIEETESLAHTPAPSFGTVATDGNTYVLNEISANRPLVLFFIKDGCPCSESAQPFYNQLFEAYGSRIPFFGIIDGDIGVAKRWARNNRVRFPILCDPDLKVVKAYAAKNSAYLAVIAPGGTIEKYWPGYSVSMLREVSLRLAKLAGMPEQPIDVRDAPDRLYSGCPY
jgi:peroxiredoxin